MASLTKRTRRDAQERREELLSVAQQTAIADGLFGLKAEVIAERAKISRPLIFHYFGSLPALQHLVIKDAVTNLLDRLSPKQMQESTGLDFFAPSHYGQEATAARTQALISTFVSAISDRKYLWLDLWAGAGQDHPETIALLSDARTELAQRLIHSLLAPSATSPEIADLVSYGWVAMAETMTARWLATGTLPQTQLVSLIGGSLDVTVQSISDGQANPHNTPT